MRIAVVEGDGIGREVIPVARDILAMLRPDFEFYPVSAGLSVWKEMGRGISDEGLAALRDADAVLFGAVTTPPSPEYRSVVVQIRKELDLFANIRPVRGPDVDLVIVRENTEGLYSGIEEIGEDRATTLRVLTRKGCERIARFGCRLAGERRRLTIGHKANVLKSDAFFREICLAEATAAGIDWDERYIDALCLEVLQRPGAFDVILTTNLFGDILSDVAAYLVGGLGLLPSANIGDSNALFEPVHGSAPDIAGRGIADPIAAIRSAAMLLAYTGNHVQSALVEEGIVRTLARGIKTRDLGGTASTREFGAAVSREIECLIREGTNRGHSL
ncbi:MAG: isocitrate/isopropylmalate dehydrogenase family protein [Methanoregulaceae archaeon]|nr:isocitrate/isopropylmalate dehydrogenase family protein [Methanoregulaceae archaeon]